MPTLCEILLDVLLKLLLWHPENSCCVFLGVPKECLMCFHVAWGFYSSSPGTVFLKWFIKSARHTAVSDISGYDLRVHLVPFTSNGHFCLFCENHLVIPLLLQRVTSLPS